MNLAELQKILRAADPAAVLVSVRILERVIRESCRLPNMYWNIPHPRSYVCDRQLLFRHAEQADLELEPDQLLPDTVILLARPDPEELSNLERKLVLLKYWRRLFHSRVHLELAPLTADAVRERIAEIGRTEFEEIRTVLCEDRYLPPNPDDTTTYVEFAAVYLELRYFAAHLLTNYFPGIRDFGRVERLLGRDVDAPYLFAHYRLRDAPDPVMTPDTRSDESQEAYWKLVRSAQGAVLAGNTVGAAILRMRASRIAPAALTLSTRSEAEGDIAHLTFRLAEALGLGATEAAEWNRHLTLLLDKADQGARPTEARVLEDLQKVCLDHEKDVYTLDLVEYVLSGGKRPIKRPLPSQRLVRITKHLRAASQKLVEVRLGDADRGRLAGLVDAALKKSEDGLRARFGPVLVTALEDVGLRPGNPIERAAFDKMVGELLDRITSYGFLTFAELRDTIARNQLKLPDLTEPEDFLRGDALVRLDRRLASLLDGVYRPSEFYTRWLERGTSLLFGTGWGRLVSRFVLLPLAGAWLGLHAVGLVLAWLFPSPRFPFLSWVSLVLLGPGQHAAPAPAYQTAADVAADLGSAAPGPLATEGTRMLGDVAAPHWLWHVGVLLPAAALVLALTQSRTFRWRCMHGLLAGWQGLVYLFWRLPVQVLPLGTLRWVIGTWVVQLLYWYVIKPGVLCALLVLLFRGESAGHADGTRSSWFFGTWYGVLFVFALVAFLLNSRVGRVCSEAVQDAVQSMATLVRAGLLPGLIRFCLQVFKQVVEWIEYSLFVVDEWLRFRSGAGRASLVVRTLLGVLWYPVSFLARFYMIVLIEPGVNPVKFPLAVVMAKVMLPLWPLIYGLLQEPLSKAVGQELASAIIWFHIFWLPDLFVFLIWEIKENWRLYRANRGESLEPVAVGSHGETVRGLLQPGFHSGTVPQLYAKLRIAERQATKTRSWQAARAYRHEIEEMCETLRNFVAREMVALLVQSRCWQGVQVAVGQVHLATNRIRIELVHADFPVQPVEVEIEHRHGWLMARVRNNGWLENISAEQLRAFCLCLAGLYKRADVDLVREQLQWVLDAPTASLELTPEGLSVRPDLHGEPTFHPLREHRDDPEAPESAQRLLFTRAPILWERWVACWEKDQDGEGQPGLPGLGEFLVRLPGSERPGAAVAPGHDGVGPAERGPVGAAGEEVPGVAPSAS
jgi:hypothetical protein